MAFVSSTIPSIIWSERMSIRYIAVSSFTIIGWTVGFASWLQFAHPVLTSLLSLTATVFVLFAFKNIDLREMEKSSKKSWVGKT